MARIAYILLCHKDPDAVIAQVRSLTSAGDAVAIHLDARAARADYRRIQDALAGNPSVAFTRRRVRCGWGDWSLVAASIEGLRTALSAFGSATHFYMLSGDCMPIKTAEHAHALLDREDADYIESFDYFDSGWIKTGIREERLIYRHWFNERRNKGWFYRSLEWQRRLGLARQIPAGLSMQIGSQWWCLRRRTVKALLAFIAHRPDIVRFFRTTWIPDETFFQTLVRHLAPEGEIRSRTLTFLLFTDYGMPVVFHDDHHDLLLAQDHLFARKISAGALDLRRKLADLYGQKGRGFPIANDGAAVHRYLTGRGRVGQRLAPRIWERDEHLGEGRRLLMIVSKKWGVGKHLAERIREATGTAAVGYLFNEAATPLPNLGGLQGTVEKRNRHAVAVVRMLFDYWQASRLVLCLDPWSLDLMRELSDNADEARLLEVESAIGDDYLAGHARRLGLANGNTPGSTMERLLVTLRHDLAAESERIRKAGFRHHYRLRENAPVDEGAGALARFLDLDEDRAREIATAENLFTE